MAKKVVLLLFILLLTACGQNAAPVATPTKIPATSTPKPQITPTPTFASQIDLKEADLDGVQISVWHSWYGAPQALFDMQVAAFNEENPYGINVSAAYQGSYNMLFNAVDEALVAGTTPDLVVALPEQISVWHEADAVNDLTPYLLDPDWGMTVAEQDDIPTVFLAQDQHDDGLLALPAQRTARFLLYNATWGEELGFGNAPTDFDDFRKQACAANLSMRADEDLENDGKGGWIVDDDSTTVLAWLYAFGGTPLNEAGDYEFLTDENIATFREIKALYDDGCAWLSTANTPYEQFATRKALFITASMEEFNDITRTFAETGSRDDWLVIPFPGTEESVVVASGASYTVLATEDAEALASWLFVKWLLAPPQQAKWVKSTALFPLRISALDELSDYEASNPHWRQAVDLLSDVEIQPRLASWRQMRLVLGDGWEYIYRYNTQEGSVSAILALMDKTAEDLSD